MTEFEKIATECRAAADFYLEKPGLAQMALPGALSDIYRTLGRLAMAADKAHRAAVVHVDPD